MFITLCPLQNKMSQCVNENVSIPSLLRLHCPIITRESLYHTLPWKGTVPGCRTTDMTKRQFLPSKDYLSQGNIPTYK